MKLTIEEIMKKAYDEKPNADISKEELWLFVGFLIGKILMMKTTLKFYADVEKTNVAQDALKKLEE